MKKMSINICEINNFEYLQKLKHAEIMRKICNNIYTNRSLTSSSIQSSKYKHTNQFLKVNFNCLYKQ